MAEWAAPRETRYRCSRSPPGVYRFRDDAGRVLYLGRATSLRRRVASYWGNLGGRAHLRRMVARGQEFAQRNAELAARLTAPA